MNNVALVVGHRYGSQGAYGAAGVSEYRYWDDFLDDLMRRLGNPPWLRKFHRQDRRGYTRNMKQLHAEIDRWGAKYAISFHFDAADSRTANGHTVLYDEQNKESKRVAQMFDRLYDVHLHNRDRNLIGRHQGRGGGFLRRGKSVNVLLESYFASHQKSFMPGTAGYEALMKAIIDGVTSLHQGKEVKPVPNARPADIRPTYHLGSRSSANLAKIKNTAYVNAVEKAITITDQDFSVLPGGRLVPYPHDGDPQKVLDALTAAMIGTA